MTRKLWSDQYPAFNEVWSFQVQNYDRDLNISSGLDSTKKQTLAQLNFWNSISPVFDYRVIKPPHWKGHVIFYINNTVCGPKIDMWPINMLLLKNPQFLPNFFESWSKWPTHEVVILTKSQINWVKIVDFLNNSMFMGHMSILGPHTVLGKVWLRNPFLAV